MREAEKQILILEKKNLKEAYITEVAVGYTLLLMSAVVFYVSVNAVRFSQEYVGQADTMSFFCLILSMIGFLFGLEVMSKGITGYRKEKRCMEALEAREAFGDEF